MARCTAHHAHIIIFVAFKIAEILNHTPQVYVIPSTISGKRYGTLHARFVLIILQDSRTISTTSLPKWTVFQTRTPTAPQATCNLIISGHSCFSTPTIENTTSEAYSRIIQKTRHRKLASHLDRFADCETKPRMSPAIGINKSVWTCNVLQGLYIDSTLGRCGHKLNSACARPLLESRYHHTDKQTDTHI